MRPLHISNAGLHFVARQSLHSCDSGSEKHSPKHCWTTQATIALKHATHGSERFVCILMQSVVAGSWPKFCFAQSPAIASTSFIMRIAVSASLMQAPEGMPVPVEAPVLVPVAVVVA